MNEKSFKLTVTTPEETVFSGEVTSLVAPGELGYLGVLVGHAPLVTPLQKGRVTATLPSGARKTFMIAGGFLDVGRSGTVVLADGAEPLAH